MQNTKAILVEKNKIDVFVSDEKFDIEHFSYSFKKDGRIVKNIDLIKKDKKTFSLLCKSSIKLGHDYIITVNEHEINLDVSKATEFHGFDEEYFYDGDDLGAIYSKRNTLFSVWAPLASSVELKLESDDSFILYPMERTEHGVYRVKIDGNLINKKYHYLVKNSGVIFESNDPYGKGVSLNSEYSVVVDYVLISKNKRYKPKNKITNYVDSIIYETNVRDFTESCPSITEKGKYLGFVEEGKKTSSGNPAGIDYLKFLGITHVQLNPILDFDNVRDDNPSKSYNWGYDPISMFALEGSYSSNPNDAFSRLKEFSYMVEKLHHNNIRVIVDVVYNHTFKYETSCYEKIVPNYFFRKTKDGKIANASGCGNDFASERKMARKLIIDSAKYLTQIFNVDGFRFDLMGLLDVETINALYNECKKIKNNLIFYGEGWNMGNELPMSQKASTENARKLPNVGFFNDTYRDVIKGPTSKDRIKEKGYINGDIMYQFGMDYIFFSSVKDISYKPKFSDANQSIIYCECHDNHTLFDKLKESNPNESDETLIRRVRLANDILMVSYGVPFIHAGQEIGQSKEGLDNTYNVTKINNFNWELLDQRFEMASHLRNMILLRKYLFYTKLHSLNDIEKSFTIEHWNNGIYVLKTTSGKYSRPFKKIVIMINVLNSDFDFELDDDYKLIHSINNISKHAYNTGISHNISLSILVN